MQADLKVQAPIDEDETRSFHRSPFALFLITLLVIFITELLLMMFIPTLQCETLLCEGLLDAALLSILVTPTIYFLFFKPLRNNILSLERSERYQQQLQEIDRTKNDFIAVAAHELCTPVAAIMGYSELMLEQIEEGDQKQYLDIIFNKSLALERIIDDLLDLNQFGTSHRIQVHKERNNLSDTIKPIIDYYRRNNPVRTINTSLSEDGPIFSYDHIRLSQVIDNILSNAIKYSDSVHDEVDLNVEDEGDQVLIRVKDEGIGMSPGDLEKVFEKFYRADAEKSSVSGLGLGMAIVKGIVESHNGRIDIISQSGVGTTVDVRLPKDG